MFIKVKWPKWNSPRFRQWVVKLKTSGNRQWVEENRFVTLHGPACKDPVEPDFGEGDTIFGGNVDPMKVPYPPFDPVLASFCAETWRFKI